MKYQRILGVMLLLGTVSPACGRADEGEAVPAKKPITVASAELSLVPKPHVVKALEGQPWRLGAAMRVRVPEHIPKAKEHFQVVAGALEMLADTDTRFVDRTDEADLEVVVKHRSKN